MAKTSSGDSGLPRDNESTRASRSDGPNAQAKQLRNRPEQPPGSLGIVKHIGARLVGAFLHWLGMEPHSILQPRVTLADEMDAIQAALPSPEGTILINQPATRRATQTAGAKARRQAGDNGQTHSHSGARTACGADPKVKCLSCSQIEQYCADKPWTSLPRYKHLMPCLDEHSRSSISRG